MKNDVLFRFFWELLFWMGGGWSWLITMIPGNSAWNRDLFWDEWKTVTLEIKGWIGQVTSNDSEFGGILRRVVEHPWVAWFLFKKGRRFFFRPPRHQGPSMFLEEAADFLWVKMFDFAGCGPYVVGCLHWNKKKAKLESNRNPFTCGCSKRTFQHDVETHHKVSNSNMVHSPWKKRGSLEVFCFPLRALCIFSEVELLCCKGLVRSWNVLYSPLFIRGTWFFLDSTSYEILRYPTIKWDCLLVLFLLMWRFSFLPIVCVGWGWIPWRSLLFRTDLSAGDCRQKGFWKLSLLPRTGSVTNFENEFFWKRKFDVWFVV